MSPRGRQIAEGLGCIAIVAALSACVAMPSKPSALPAPAVGTLVCVAYTPDQRQAIGRSLARLTPGDPLIGATADYLGLRQRVCPGG